MTTTAPTQFTIDLAAVCGTTPKNNDKISAAIKQAKDALGIATHTRSLTADDRAAIIEWHKSLSDNKQVDIETLATVVALRTDTAIIEQVETIPDDDTAPRPLHIDTTIIPVRINNANIETAPTALADDTAINERYDFNAMVQLSVWVGARKQCHIAIDGFYLNALMTMAGIDKKGVKEWVQNAVDGWGAFDPKLNITRQVRCLIVRELEKAYK